jgi:hypothetical protein
MVLPIPTDTKCQAKKFTLCNDEYLVVHSYGLIAGFALGEVANAKLTILLPWNYYI